MTCCKDALVVGEAASKPLDIFEALVNPGSVHGSSMREGRTQFHANPQDVVKRPTDQINPEPEGKFGDYLAW